MIGAGTVSRYQLSALAALSDEYEVTAVCDVDRAKAVSASESLERRPRVFYSAQDLLDFGEFDAVLISSPPKVHAELALAALKDGKDVLIEKPAALSMRELDDIYAAADAEGAIAHVAYHAAFAADLIWYLGHKNELAARYGLSALTSINCGFYDPYIKNGKLDEDKRSLMGCFVDSGINELSVAYELASLDGLKPTTTLRERNADGLDVMVDAVLSRDDLTLSMRTSWNSGIDRKTTILTFKDGRWQIALDHSAQRVVLLNCREEVCDGDDRRRPAKILFENAGEDRLTRQYIGVFSDFSDALSLRRDNREKTMKIHGVLFANHQG